MKWMFRDDLFVFKPFLYAPKSFRAIGTKTEEAESVEVTPEASPKKMNPALYGAGFTTLFLASLWYWSTAKANRTTSTSLVPQFITQYEKGIRGFDFLIHRLFHPAISQRVVSEIGIPEVLYESLRMTKLERIPATFDLVKMVANPTPMPFTKVWHSAAEFARTLRLTAFLGFAKEDAIKLALSDSLLFPSIDAEKTARMFASMRSTLVKRGAAGLLGGLTVGFIPGFYIPGYSFIAGSLIPYNVAAIFNSYSQCVSNIEQKLKVVAPESTAKLNQHVDAFWKGKVRMKATGTAGLVTAFLGYTYFQYKAFKKVLGTNK
jgi:hypothetical protein